MKQQAQPQPQAAQNPDGSLFGNLGKPKQPKREGRVNFGGREAQVILFSPKTFDEAGEIVNHIRANRSVVMTLEGLPSETARRLLGQLLGGEHGHIEGFLIGAVFLYLIDKDLHLALEDGVFLLSGRDIIGDLLKEIINGGHVIAAYAGFLKSLFTDILCSDHILIHLSSICVYQK